MILFLEHSLNWILFPSQISQSLASPKNCHLGLSYNQWWVASDFPFIWVLEYLWDFCTVRFSLAAGIPFAHFRLVFCTSVNLSSGTALSFSTILGTAFLSLCAPTEGLMVLEQQGCLSEFLALFATAVERISRVWSWSLYPNRGLGCPYLLFFLSLCGPPEYQPAFLPFP